MSIRAFANDYALAKEAMSRVLTHGCLYIDRWMFRRLKRHASLLQKAGIVLTCKS